MPKDTKKPSLISSDQSPSYPYSNKPQLKHQEKRNEIDEKECKEATCVACLESPHNPVLLVCSSHEKGCRPYMCDTSPLLSNCLVQYHKSLPLEGLTCPLCRGGIVKDPIPASNALLEYMNSKLRDCSRENCEFRGTYSELIEHARENHVKASGDVASLEEMRPVSNVGRRTMRIKGGYYPIWRRNQPRRFVYYPSVFVNY